MDKIRDLTEKEIQTLCDKHIIKESEVLLYKKIYDELAKAVHEADEKEGNYTKCANEMVANILDYMDENYRIDYLCFTTDDDDDANGVELEEDEGLFVPAIDLGKKFRASININVIIKEDK